ncbi:hypothetical protein [Brevibacillus reuszeri]|uniref:hypothetical protein n=1 Tax=Brevibacillus reuszeri TaxID=54915 RepID=UPI003D2592BE
MKKIKKSAIVLFTLISALAFNAQSIFAANVSDWDKFLSKGADYTYSSPSFDMKSSSIGISGYQYLPAFTTPQTAKYSGKGFFLR